MFERIENEYLKVEISPLGAELKSIFHKQKYQEYLWQGDSTWWPRNAPVLFPIVGKLNNNSYKVDGKKYSLPQHGFARDMEFSVFEKAADSIVFELRSNEETLAKFPYTFSLKITYRLEENRLFTNYKVKNLSLEEMYFSIGAHPGFICPMYENETLEDYYLEFEKKETLQRHLLDNGLFNGESEIIMTDTSILSLHPKLFEKDAIVFKNMDSKCMILKSKKSDYRLEFSFEGFPYFGIWQKPGAPFICLEPWCGIADNKGFDGSFSEKEGIVKLAGNEVFKRGFSIEV
ncbi:MAG: aldose 1-epimerase family protein [Sphingobacteriales bacterium]|nr:MAG: aldose 1-epimerase family protein [Sphingobacteriales bacterium]